MIISQTSGSRDPVPGLKQLPVSKRKEVGTVGRSPNRRQDELASTPTIADFALIPPDARRCALQVSTRWMTYVTYYYWYSTSFCCGSDDCADGRLRNPRDLSWTGNCQVRSCMETGRDDTPLHSTPPGVIQERPFVQAQLCKQAPHKVKKM